MRSLDTESRTNGLCGRWKTCVQDMQSKFTTPPRRGRALSRPKDTAAGVCLHGGGSVMPSPSFSPATILFADGEEDEAELNSLTKTNYTLGELIQQEEKEPMMMAEIESGHFSCSSSFSFPRMESEWLIDSPVMMIHHYQMLEQERRADYKGRTASLSSDVKPTTFPTAARRRIFGALRKKPIKQLFTSKFSVSSFVRQPWPKDHLLSKEMEMAKKILLLLSEDIGNVGSSIDHEQINSTEYENGDKEIVSIEMLQEMNMKANFRAAQLENGA